MHKFQGFRHPLAVPFLLPHPSEASSSFILLVVVLDQVSGPRCGPMEDWFAWRDPMGKNGRYVNFMKN